MAPASFAWACFRAAPITVAESVFHWRSESDPCNFPEGAIISMPLKSEGQMSRKKAFLYGTLSGAVEPVGAALTIALASVIDPFLPYLSSFKSGR